MHPVYATRLHVQLAEDQPCSSSFSDLTDAIRTWFEEQSNDHGFAVDEVTDRSLTREWQPGDTEWRIYDDQQRRVGHINCWAMSSDLEQLDDYDSAWQFEIEHPLTELGADGAASDRSLLIRTEVQARVHTDAAPSDDGTSGRHGMVVLRQFVSTQEEDTRPRDPDLPPPSLARRLVEDSSVTCGGVPQSRSYWSFSTPRIDVLVQRIANSVRTLPIVVISPNRDGDFLVDPRTIGPELLGVAKIAVLETPRAATEFGQRIPGTFPCYNGAVRVFDGGFTPHDSASRHRVWLPDHITRRGEHFAPWLCQHLIRDSAKWIWPDNVVAQLQQERRARGVTQLLDIVSEIRQGLSTWGELENADLPGFIQDLAQSAERSTDDTKQLQAELSAKREEIFRLKSRIAALEGEHGHGGHHDGPHDGEPFEPSLHATSLLEAVQIVQAESSNSRAIEFLPCAIESAKHVQIDDPNDALTKLRALCDVAQNYHDNPGDGTTLQKAFEQHGIRYSQKVDPSTRGQHKIHYICNWTYHGTTRKIKLDPHIRLSQEYRVYWHLDKQLRMFVVGNVGDHLPDSTTG